MLNSELNNRIKELDIPDTSLSLERRVRFICAAVEEYGPKSILDIGCGTGEHLTQFIAKLYPDLSIVGFDPDIKSIEAARQKVSLKNLKFTEKFPGETFDFIIASEVLEHVTNPNSFLYNIYKHLSSNGICVITVPNGYSLFELLYLAEHFCYRIGVVSFLKNIQRKIQRANKNPKHRSHPKDTESISPHINFFSYRSIRRLFNAEKLSIEKYQGRMFLYGFGLAQLINMSKWLIRFNEKCADALPVCLVSDWMFVCRKTVKEKDYYYKRNLYARVKAFLNCKRYDIPTPYFLKGHEKNTDVASFFSNNRDYFLSGYAMKESLRKRFEVWQAILDSYVKLPMRVLDIGCGSGVLSFYLAQKNINVTGIDMSEEMISYCREYAVKNNIGNCAFFCGDIRAWNTSQTYDCILASSVLEYMNNLPSVIKILSSVLSKQGIIIVSFPNKESLYRKYEKKKYRYFKRPHYYRFIHNILYPQEARKLFSDVGFICRETVYYAREYKGSRILRWLGLPEENRSNMFLCVFQKV